MDIELADQHVFVLDERLSADEVRQRAMDRRTGAFGTGIGSLLQRPKPDDIELVATQRRLEPFWHVACQARYVYQRSHDYTIATSGPEVRQVSVNGQDYVVGAPTGHGTFVLPTVEHCRDEFTAGLFTDGVTGAAVADAATIVAGPHQEVVDLATLSENNTIVVSPEQHASFVVRQLLGSMMKPVQADVVTEESMTIQNIDLYYRPWWAFEFHWKPKDKRGVVELDAVTGQMRPGTALSARVSRIVSRDALFDIGADTVGLLVPGGSIAVKVARVAMEQSRRPS
ncbi:MAG TPA: hypothetical protein VGC90_10340 [Candidatus Limnocylindrales bacterium]|jgi:hypothetical protein